MGKLMKGAYLSSLKALQVAGIEKPDAVISGTIYGCLENSEKILGQIEEGEEGISPTLFMQSTHNTIGSEVARRLGCHGYNITYTHGAQSFKWAVQDATLLIGSGRCKSVLVGMHDEYTPDFGALMGDALETEYIISYSVVLTCGE